MTAEKPLTIECARCYSTAIVPILSFGRGPRGDDTVGCAACGYTWPASKEVTAAVVDAEQAWVESQAATEDDPPLHRLRDGTTGTTLEALAEAQREVEGLEREKAALEGQVEVTTAERDARTRLGRRAASLWMAATRRIDALRVEIDGYRVSMQAADEKVEALTEQVCREQDASEDARVRQRRAERQRDALADGLREACNLVQRWSADPENPVSSWRPLSVREALTRLRTLAESFHPSAQPPGTTGESGSVIVSPVATEIPVATERDTTVYRVSYDPRTGRTASRVAVECRDCGGVSLKCDTCRGTGYEAAP